MLLLSDLHSLVTIFILLRSSLLVSTFSNYVILQQQINRKSAHSLFALPRYVNVKNTGGNQTINTVIETTDSSRTKPYNGGFEEDLFRQKNEFLQFEEDLEQNATDQSFDWFDHWYPVNVADTMDPTRPHRTQLLGLNLVLWNSAGESSKVSSELSAASWNAFNDACPHRRAPLSEGRIEIDDNNDATLFCSYHGWSFNEGGSCASLPYSPSKVKDRHRQAPRACAEVYPTRTVDGFIWVFPQSGLKGIMRSEQRALPLISELQSRKGQIINNNKIFLKSKIPAGVRDFPCSFDTMIENTLDPAHFCAAHHGTLGNRYTDPAPYSYQKRKQKCSCSTTNVNSMQQQLREDKGVAAINKCVVDLEGGMGSLQFIPPCLVKYSPNYPAMPFEETVVIATYCVPTKPGWVRPLATVALLEDAEEGGGNKKNLLELFEDIRKTPLSKIALSIFMNPITPIWFGHIASSIILHQDAGLLRYQYQNMKNMGYYDSSSSNSTLTNPMKSRTSYNEICFTPNSVDKGIVTFRRWWETKAGGNVPWASGPSSSDHLDSQVDIFDMWDAHTKHCTYCQDAYRRLENLKKVSYAVAFGGLIFQPMLMMQQSNYENYMSTSLLILLALGLGLALEKFNELFIRYEYHHHDNN